MINMQKTTDIIKISLIKVINDTNKIVYYRVDFTLYLPEPGGPTTS